MLDQEVAGVVSRQGCLVRKSASELSGVIAELAGGTVVVIVDVADTRALVECHFAEWKGWVLSDVIYKLQDSDQGLHDPTRDARDLA